MSPSPKSGTPVLIASVNACRDRASLPAAAAASPRRTYAVRDRRSNGDHRIGDLAGVGGMSEPQERVPGETCGQRVVCSALGELAGDRLDRREAAGEHEALRLLRGPEEVEPAGQQELEDLRSLLFEVGDDERRRARAGA